MKTHFIFASMLLIPFSASMAAPESYTLDPSHSSVMWQINHLGYSEPSGKWLANGTISYDAAKVQNSKVNVTIKVDNMITGLPELEEHLKGRLFFDTAKFPTATFVSDKIDVTGSKTANIHGKLTVHGVTKPIVLKVKLNKAGPNPLTNKETLGFSATATLKRSDYEIKTLLPALGDEVKLTIEAEAIKEK